MIERRLKKMRKVLAIILTMVLVLGGTALPVLAGDADVSTSATIDGGGSPPFICAKWETPDWDETTQGVQVMPNPGTSKDMKFYVVAGDPNGIDDIAAIDVTVRYDDGTEKFQLRAIKGSWTQIPWGGLVDLDGDCSGETDVETAMTQLDAAGSIAYGAGMDLGKVLYDLRYEKQILIELAGTMDFHQPSMHYTVEVVATDEGGDTGDPVTNTFFLESIVALFIDFDTAGINWQTVNVNTWNYLLGDEDLTTSARPTVRNIGNDPGMLMVEADPMIGVTAGKEIDDFDVEMEEKDEQGNVTKSGRIEFDSTEQAIVTVQGSSLEPIKLEPCRPTQIDFSLHPPFGSLQDTYTGKIYLTILHYQNPLDPGEWPTNPKPKP
jgi:hypothetical protein